MQGFPIGWSEPEGPSLIDEPSRPWSDPLPRSEWLTTKRENRRARLKGTGNAVVIDVGEVIGRSARPSQQEAAK